MTISFDCPGCKGICAFPDKHAGKSARCTRCQQRFVIPSENGAKAKKIKLQLEEEGPISGFYRAVMHDSLKSLSMPNSPVIVSLLSLLAIIKFFMRFRNYVIHIRMFSFYLMFGYFATFIVIASLLRYYLKIIYASAYDFDELPPPTMCNPLIMIGKMAQTLYCFLIMITIAMLPFIIVASILLTSGLCTFSYQKGFTGATVYKIILICSACPGAYILPSMLTAVSVGGELMQAFRPQAVIKPIVKAPLPYLFASSITILFLVSHVLCFNVGFKLEGDPMWTALGAGLSVAVTLLTIPAMWTLGLFYKHYGCYMDF